MGYKVQRKIFKLKFEDPDYEGLVVRVKSPNMGVFLDISMMDDTNIDFVLQTFADSIVEWNLEEDDVAVPTTLEGLRAQDSRFVMDMISAWVGAVRGTDSDLTQPSSDGQQSLEASIPMEDWSANLQSLAEPASS